MSLSDLTGIPKEELKGKFGLEPLYQYHRDESENLVFMSPIVLLDDSQLRHGGIFDMGAEKVLSLVTKDILKEKDLTAFQVPELTCLHMGYGKKSENKEGKIAINEKEAKTWFNYLKVSLLKLGEEDPKRPGTNIGDEEKREVMDPDSQTVVGTKDYDRYDDTVYPSDSGLLLPQKGSCILCMSILIMNSIKKPEGKELNCMDNTVRFVEDLALSEEDGDSRGRVGPNKISDFLLFWMLPFLLNYTQRKVEKIFRHYEANKRKPEDFVKTVKKSALDIFTEATQSKPEMQATLREKLERYFSEEKLKEKYTLLECDGSPVVLVPLQYIFEDGKPDPLRLEDIGHKWTREEDGSPMTKEEFLSAFVSNREVQMDYFNCMKDATLRQGVDYAVIFPDESVFDLLLKTLHPNTMTILKDVKSQGRGMITPRHLVVKCTEGNVVLCFAYLQGTDRSSVSGLFRAVGAHYCNHFTVIFLHGATRSKHDIDCKLGNLYSVRGAKQFSIKKGKLQKDDNQICFRKGMSQFTSHDFPRWYGWWEKEVSSDSDVIHAKQRFGIVPTFDPTKHLNVAFAKAAQQENLRNMCLSECVKIGKSNEKRLTKCDIHAASLNGHLLATIQQCGREDNIGVILAINNTLGNDDPPTLLMKAIKKIIYYFVLAVINAGLRKVFPSEPDKEDREKIESGQSSSSSSSSSEEEEEDELMKEAKRGKMTERLRRNSTMTPKTTGKRNRKVPTEKERSEKKQRRSTRDISGDGDDDDDDDDETEEEEEEEDSEDEEWRPQDGKNEMGDDDNTDYPMELDAESYTEPSTSRSGSGTKKLQSRCEAPTERVSSEGMDEEEVFSQEPSTTRESAAVTHDHPAVKTGTPCDNILEELANDIDPECWKKLGRRLKVEEPKLTAIDKENEQYCEKAYKMLLYWKQMNASAASFKILFDALSNKLVKRMDLAVNYCCE